MARVNGYPACGPEGPFRAPVRRRKAMRPSFPEKVRRIKPRPVPNPTQVGGYKETKARGRNLVKELGNMAP